MVSRCSPAWPETSRVERVGLEFTKMSATASASVAAKYVHNHTKPSQTLSMRLLLDFYSYNLVKLGCCWQKTKCSIFRAHFEAKLTYEAVFVVLFNTESYVAEAGFLPRTPKGMGGSSVAAPLAEDALLMC